MKTITPSELQVLIDNGGVELIDVRPRKDFEKIHALTARSIPLSEFEPHSVLAHRKSKKDAPLYLMCRNQTLASLAACGLTSAGLDEPIVVEGGLDGWAEQCLPVVRGKSWRMPELAIVFLLVGLVIGLSLTFHGFAFAAFLIFAGWALPHLVRFALDRHRDVNMHRWQVAQAAECR